VNAPQDMVHTEVIAIVVGNGTQPGNVSVSVSLIGNVACRPLLAAVSEDQNTTRDIVTGPIVVATQQSTRLDFIELGMRADEVRNTSRQYTVNCLPGGPHSFQIIVNAASGFPDPDVTNNQDQNHPTVSVCCPDLDADGIANGMDTCPALVNPSQTDTDGDGSGDACDDDDDNDEVSDELEDQCGSDRVNSGKIPERIDGAFAGVDDDGDTQIDEPLPLASASYDCDQDGYTGQRESHIFGVSGRDQDPCGNDGWPSDLVGDGQSSVFTVSDMGSFVAPVRRLDTSAGDPQFDVRWDLNPGTISGEQINLSDLAALISTTSGYPPMLAGHRAFGQTCPWAP
jgi:hypothetical protein